VSMTVAGYTEEFVDALLCEGACSVSVDDAHKDTAREQSLYLAGSLVGERAFVYREPGDDAFRWASTWDEVSRPLHRPKAASQPPAHLTQSPLGAWLMPAPGTATTSLPASHTAGTLVRSRRAARVSKREITCLMLDC
jgi:hypothetical protein